MKVIFRIFSSLELTVWLLASSLVLIFFGTLDQVHWGIQEVQRRYFQSFFALWAYPEQWLWGRYLRGWHLPIPGGYLIGPLLVANLLCAHFRYFRPRWKNFGIVLIHLGILLLLVNQLATNLLQRDNFLWFAEGETKNYVESFHEEELAVIETSDPAVDKVTAIPLALLEAGQTLSPPRLPFRLRVLKFFRNATLVRDTEELENSARATQGLAPRLQAQAVEAPLVFSDRERNATTLLVEIETAEGSLGIWLVSLLFNDRFPPQSFSYAGKTYTLTVRSRRTYLPFSLTLLDFTHDRYPGTEIPKNFSSRVRLVHPVKNENREFLIYMNHPLRYEGLTFYQASFRSNDRESQLQVVENPGWQVPYWACGIVSAGMLWQFGIGLYSFARASRENISTSVPASPVLHNGL